MIRSVFITGTIAGTVTTDITFAENVEITRLCVQQTSADFNVYLVDRNSSTGRLMYSEGGGYDYLMASVRYWKAFADMVDIKIQNEHASNEIVYYIFGKEHLT